MSIRVAIVDDHALMVRGVKNLLNDQDGIEVTATYQRGEELLEAFAQNHLPDILLMDIQLPDQNGNELVRVITRLYPSVKIIALTSMDTIFHIKDMMQHGCMGYITKQAEDEVIIEAIRHVYEGAEYLEENIKERWMKSLLKDNKQQSQMTALSRREKEILKLIVAEYTTQEIADKLCLSLRTAESHRYSLIQKLNVKNTAGLVRVAVQMGLID